MAKIHVVRAEMGKIVESTIIEGDFFDVIKRYVVKASSEWDPRVSDFIVIRENLDVEIEGSLDDDVVSSLNTYGFIEASGGLIKVRIPVYTVSFDNRAVGEDEYVENKIYLITLYVNEDLKTFFEVEAANITSGGKPPSGIREV